MRKIVQDGESEVLRTIAKDVPKELFGSSELAEIIADMKKALDKEPDGVAIAAPQLAIPYKIFLVSHKVARSKRDPLIYINPRILKTSKEKKYLQEGCLSVRWLYGEVERFLKVEVEAYNEKGEIFTRGASGLMAHIFQHEIDHLYGTLFIDKAHNLERLSDENISKIQNSTNS
jgi:peptide deformylase